MVMICAIWICIGFALLLIMQKGTTFVILMQLLMEFGLAAPFPILYTLAGVSVRKDQPATAVGICNGASIIGGVFPMLLGILINAGGGFDYTTGFNYGLVVMIGASVITFVILLLFSYEVTGPRKGKDWALTSFESCGIEKE